MPAEGGSSSYPEGVDQDGAGGAFKSFIMTAGAVFNGCGWLVHLNWG